MDTKKIGIFSKEVIGWSHTVMTEDVWYCIVPGKILILCSIVKGGEL